MLALRPITSEDGLFATDGDGGYLIRLAAKRELGPVLAVAHDYDVRWRVKLIAEAELRLTAGDNRRPPRKPARGNAMREKRNLAIRNNAPHLWFPKFPVPVAAAAQELKALEFWMSVLLGRRRCKAQHRDQSCSDKDNSH